MAKRRAICQWTFFQLILVLPSSIPVKSCLFVLTTLFVWLFLIPFCWVTGPLPEIAPGVAGSVPFSEMLSRNPNAVLIASTYFLFVFVLLSQRWRRSLKEKGGQKSVN